MIQRDVVIESEKHELDMVPTVNGAELIFPARSGSFVGYGYSLPESRVTIAGNTGGLTVYLVAHKETRAVDLFVDEASDGAYVFDGSPYQPLRIVAEVSAPPGVPPEQFRLTTYRIAKRAE